MYFDAARMGGAGPRYVAKREGVFRTTTWAENLAAVEEIGAGLIQLGVEPGSRIAILSENRPEWMEADLAALACGCVTVPIYPSSPAAECAYLLVDSQARLVFVENRTLAEKLAAALREGTGSARFPSVDSIVVIDGQAPGCFGLSDLRGRGRDAGAAAAAELQRRSAALGRGDAATIVYTSGTTGLPKGVLQSHGNHLAALEAIAALGIAMRGEVDFEFLNPAHSFSRMLEFLGIFMGTVTAFGERSATLMDDLVKLRPHLLPAVPRVFEGIYASIQRSRAEQSGPAQALFDWALAVGERRAAHLNRGEPVPSWLQALDAVAHRMVFDAIHARLGGRVRLLVSGGAPLDPDIIGFFHAVGLPLLEGYGLTETTPILTINRPGATRIGSVGQAFPGIALRIGGDGEILAKGPNVAAGYYNLPAETAEAWDAEGWLHTGDIGEIDAEGYLKITDRKKELIKTAGGKYVAPQKIENLLRARPLIGQAVVIGDRLRYCVALVTLDAEAARQLARRLGLDVDAAADLAGLEAVLDAVEHEIDAVNEGLASHEAIRRFRVLPGEFTVEGGELTPSLKLRRRFITERYRAEVESMVGAGVAAA